MDARPKKILYVDTLTTLYGGAEISLLALMKNLEPTRYQPYLLTGGPGGFVDATRQAGIPTSTQDFPWLSRRRPWPYFSSILKISRLIRTQRITLVHTNCERSPVYVRRACQITGTPYICHIRDNVRDWRSNARWKALKHAQAVIFNSKSLANIYRESGLAEQQVRVVYSPIDLSIFVERTPEKRRLERQRFGIPFQAICFAVLGQIQPHKGQMDFVQAAARIEQLLPGNSFLIIGEAHNEEDRHYCNEIKMAITKLKIIDRVIFTGHQTDIPSLLAAIDILVVPSHQEAFGRAAVEGMAAGRAVIAYQTGGLSEIVNHGENGLLVSSGDVQALSEAMLLLATNAELRARLAKQGHCTAQQYDATRHASQVQATYDCILPAA